MFYFFPGDNVTVLISVQTNLSLNALACNGSIMGCPLITNCVPNIYSRCRMNLRVELFCLLLLSCWCQTLLIAVQHFGSCHGLFQIRRSVRNLTSLTAGLFNRLSRLGETPSRNHHPNVIFSDFFLFAVCSRHQPATHQLV